MTIENPNEVKKKRDNDIQNIKDLTCQRSATDLSSSLGISTLLNKEDFNQLELCINNLIQYAATRPKNYENFQQLSQILTATNDCFFSNIPSNKKPDVQIVLRSLLNDWERPKNFSTAWIFVPGVIAIIVTLATGGSPFALLPIVIPVVRIAKVVWDDYFRANRSVQQPLLTFVDKQLAAITANQTPESSVRRPSVSVTKKEKNAREKTEEQTKESTANNREPSSTTAPKVNMTSSNNISDTIIKIISRLTKRD